MIWDLTSYSEGSVGFEELQGQGFTGLMSFHYVNHVTSETGQTSAIKLVGQN